MGITLQSHLDGQVIASDQSARRIHEERIGRPGVVEIDRWKEMPGSGAVRTGDDRPAVTPGVVEAELSATPDESGQGFRSMFSFP
jgi:hypothetical protein